MNARLRDECDVWRTLLTGGMPTSVSALSPRAHDMHKRVKQFITDHVIPQEGAIYQHMVHPDPKVRWSVIPQIEELKVSTVPTAEEPCMAKWLGVRVCVPYNTCTGRQRCSCAACSEIQYSY